MAKPLMVIVEPDESYLMPLEMKLVEILWETVDIEIISDTGYFEEYFTVPRKIDILVIDAVMYSEKLQIHNIDKTIVLTENISEQNEPEEFGQKIIHIYKFSNLNAIVNCLVPGQWENRGLRKKETKIVAVISPSGGSGATTIAMGICAVLRQNLKKILYVNSQMYQTFQFYLQNKATLPVEGYSRLRCDNGQIYEMIKPYLLIEEGIHYMPPLKSSREALGIEVSAYIDFIRKCGQVNDYDFIVVDIGNELTAETLGFLEYAKMVYIVTRQDSFSVFKLDVFRRNVNCNDAEKYAFICNCFEKEKENGLLTQTGSSPIIIQEYVERQDETPDSCEALAAIEGIQKIAYMLI